MDRVKVDASKKALASVIGALGRALRDAESRVRSHRRLATSEARWRMRFEDKLAQLGHRWNYDVVWDEEPGDRGWIVESRPVEAPNVLAMQLLPVIQRYSGERGEGETAEQTLLRIVRERDQALEDRKLFNELIEILGRHVGETGASEGAVDVLNRLVAERDEAIAKVESSGKVRPRPLAKASPRRRSV